MSLSQELFKAIKTEDIVSAKKTFDHIMAVKINAKIESTRKQVVDLIFKTDSKS